MKSYTLILNFGYAESQTTGYYPFVSTGKKFASAIEAIEDLAEFLKEKFIQANDAQPSIKQCCTDSAAANPNAKYCSECGRFLNEEEFTIDDDEFEEFLFELNGSTTDDLGRIILSDIEDRWELGLFEKNEVFIYNAEKVISSIIGIGSYTKEEIFHEFDGKCLNIY